MKLTMDMVNSVWFPMWTVAMMIVGPMVVAYVPVAILIWAWVVLWFIGTTVGVVREAKTSIGGALYAMLGAKFVVMREFTKNGWAAFLTLCQTAGLLVTFRFAMMILNGSSSMMLAMA